MESVNNVINLIKPNVYMASIDLKDAFSSVPIHNDNATTTVKVLEASLKQSTRCKYNIYIKHWLACYKTMGKIEVNHVLDFLSAMFEKWHAHSTINSAKCVIAATVHIPPPYNCLNKSIDK